MIKRKIKIYSPSEIRLMRRKVRETREEFADRFFLTSETIKGWENGRRNASGPALVILQMIEEEITEKHEETRRCAAIGRAVVRKLGR